MSTYVYLILAAWFFLLSVFVFIQQKRLRRLIIGLWLLGACMGPIAELFYFRDYWMPTSTAGRGVISVEDMLFGAGIVVLGALGWSLFSSKMHDFKPTTSRVKEFVGIATIGITSMIALFIIGVDSMASSLVSFSITIIYMLLRAPRLYKVALQSALVLLIAAAIVYFPLFTLLDANYITQHFVTAGTVLNPVILGFMPLTEMLWYIMWGMLAALSLCYLDPSIER